MVDELGNLPFRRDEANLLFDVVVRWHERGSMILMSNLPFMQWAATLSDDQTLTAAMSDRLSHHCHIVETGDDSYRFRHRSTKKIKEVKTRKTEANRAKL